MSTFKIIPAQPGWKLIDSLWDNVNGKEEIVEITETDIIAWIIDVKYFKTEKSNITSFIEDHTVEILPVTAYGETVIEDYLVKNPEGVYFTADRCFNKDPEEVLKYLKQISIKE